MFARAGGISLREDVLPSSCHENLSGEALEKPHSANDLQGGRIPRSESRSNIGSYKASSVPAARTISARWHGSKDGMKFHR